MREPFARLLSQYKFAIEDEHNRVTTLKPDQLAIDHYTKTIIGGKGKRWQATYSCPKQPYNPKFFCNPDFLNCAVSQWLMAYTKNPAVFNWHLVPQAWYLTAPSIVSSTGEVSTCDYPLLHGPNLAEDFNKLMTSYGISTRLPELPDHLHSSSNFSHELPLESKRKLRGANEGGLKHPHPLDSSSSPSSSPKASTANSRSLKIKTGLTETLVGPAVDLIYDQFIPGSRENIGAVCPNLSVRDFNTTVHNLIMNIWKEDIILWKKMKEASSSPGEKHAHSHTI